MSSTLRTSEHTQAHGDERWRVILVGRTGLDQVLRRDGSIELIRARDTIDTIGELSDPIDHESPTRVAILVAQAEQPEGDELDSFVESLRLIVPSVRVLGVGHATGFDASIEPGASFDEIMKAIEGAAISDESVSLQFVDAPPTEAKPEVLPEPELQPETVSEPEPEVAPEPERTPEVVVVVKNEDFEHRAQESFEDESDMHRDVLMGVHRDGDSAGSIADVPISIDSARVPQDPAISGDQSLVDAMTRGRSVLEPAIVCINARLGRDDVLFTPDIKAPGMPVMVGDQTVGKLVCADHSWAMGQGHEPLMEHALWLGGWVKLEVQQTELRNAAFTDSLTGAWNRRYFTRYLDAAIAQSRSARQPLTVMLFDIDGFKHYNDAYGHAAGDEILIETVKMLKSVIRPSDRVCRVGGDEFVVIFYEPNGPRDAESKPLESIYQIATRFQRQICAHRFPKLAGEAQGTLTVSGGLASFPWDGHDSESLLEQADQLAMESKRKGKNAMTLGPGAQTVCKHKPRAD